MNKHYHFIGIGGIGMSGIAHLLLTSGFAVSGSDIKESRSTESLRKAGAEVFIGHNAVNINSANLVVYSSAIHEDNPEFQEAKRRGIPLIKRAQALAQLMQDKSVVTVAGSHGKTTTTSLVSYLLMEAGLNPTVAIGGVLRNIDSNACKGEGELFVAEADESDGSFLFYQPKYSIITNIDHEHLDYYGSFEKEVEAFRSFVNKTDSTGCVFCCSDDSNLRAICKDYSGRHVLFGLNDGAKINAKNINLKGLASEFDCYCERKFLNRFALSLGGLHNISNALAVIGLGMELGIDQKHIKNTLLNYKGVGRRIEVKFEDSSGALIDDYAHHPTEIKATLKAVRNLGAKRIISIFQPHRYSRTKLLLDEFAGSFSDSDYIIITDIYPAGEEPIDGISGASIYDKVKRFCSGSKTIIFLPKEEIINHVLGIRRHGDLVITLGAGDIVKVCDELVERIKR